MRSTTDTIRDAALAEFAKHGVGGTSLKSIAATAGVSAQLVVHHFGSKEGLATACDNYVREKFRDRGMTLLGSSAPPSPTSAMGEEWLAPAMRYLAARLADDSPAVNELVDEAFADSLEYLDAGVKNGTVTPSELHRERAAVCLLWNLGALALHRHAKRLIGVDLMSSDTQHRLTWTRAATEMLTDGLFTHTVNDRLTKESEGHD